MSDNANGSDKRNAVVQIRIDDVQVQAGRHPRGDLSGLMESIRTSGLLHPIIITSEKRLVAGRNRLEACRQLGWESILATVREMEPLEAELAEIDENLVRNELSALEHSEALARRQEIYLAMHQETRPVAERGGPGRGHKTTADSAVVSEPTPLPFTRDTAEKTGVAARTIRTGVQIARELTDETKAVVRDTELADKKLELLELARVDKRHQAQVAEKVVSGEARTVRAANSQVLSELLGRALATVPDDGALARSHLRRMFSKRIGHMHEFLHLVPEAVAEVIDEGDLKAALRMDQELHAWFGKLKAARQPGLRLLPASSDPASEKRAVPAPPARPPNAYSKMGAAGRVSPSRGEAEQTEVSGVGIAACRVLSTASGQVGLAVSGNSSVRMAIVRAFVVTESSGRVSRHISVTPDMVIEPTSGGQQRILPWTDPPPVAAPLKHADSPEIRAYLNSDADDTATGLFGPVTEEADPLPDWPPDDDAPIEDVALPRSPINLIEAGSEYVELVGQAECLKEQGELDRAREIEDTLPEVAQRTLIPAAIAQAKAAKLAGRLHPEDERLLKLGPLREAQRNS